MTTKARVSAHLDVPTVAELGWPDYEASAWYGFAVPAGTPKPIIERLRAATVEAINSPVLKDRLGKEGAVAIGNSPEDFGKMIAEEHARWGAVINQAGLKHD